MMKRLATLGILALTACQDPPAPNEPVDSPLAEIVDGAQGDGSAGFFFLPPLVPDPGATGEFDPSFLPFLTVEICEWTGSDCVTPLVASFTSEPGSGSETLRIGDDKEHYIVNWHTKNHDVAPDKDYRISVLAGEVELGHADVDVVSSGRQLHGVDNSAFVALRNGRTLPIKFRVERGVTAPPGGEEVLFGFDSNRLFSLNTSTGSANFIGDVGFNLVFALAADASGGLFGVNADPALALPQLIAIDPSSGTGTLVRNVDPAWQQLTSMAFDGSNQLFGVTFADDLVALNPVTGGVLTIGGLGLVSTTAHVPDIAFAPTGEMFGVTSDPGNPMLGIPGVPAQLITIDLLTGASTTVATLNPEFQEVSGITFGPGGVLFGTSCGLDPKLLQINPATASVSVVGSLSGVVTCVSDLAFP